MGIILVNQGKMKSTTNFSLFQQKIIESKSQETLSSFSFCPFIYNLSVPAEGRALILNFKINYFKN